MLRKRALAPVLMSLVIACGSPRPLAPMPTLDPVVATPTPDAAPPPSAAVDPRIATAMVALDHLVTALEGPQGDCDAVAAALRGFADTEDGKLMIAMKDDAELTALAQQQAAAIAATYPELQTRLLAVMNTCYASVAMKDAIAQSPMFTKHEVTAPPAP